MLSALSFPITFYFLIYGFHKNPNCSSGRWILHSKMKNPSSFSRSKPYDFLNFCETQKFCNFLAAFNIKVWPYNLKDLLSIMMLTWIWEFKSSLFFLTTSIITWEEKNKYLLIYLPCIYIGQPLFNSMFVFDVLKNCKISVVLYRLLKWLVFGQPWSAILLFFPSDFLSFAASICVYRSFPPLIQLLADSIF